MKNKTFYLLPAFRMYYMLLLSNAGKVQHSSGDAHLLEEVGILGFQKGL